MLSQLRRKEGLGEKIPKDQEEKIPKDQRREGR